MRQIFATNSFFAVIGHITWSRESICKGCTDVVMNCFENTTANQNKHTTLRTCFDVLKQNEKRRKDERTWQVRSTIHVKNMGGQRAIIFNLPQGAQDYGQWNRYTWPNITWVTGKNGRVQALDNYAWGLLRVHLLAKVALTCRCWDVEGAPWQPISHRNMKICLQTKLNPILNRCHYLRMRENQAGNDSAKEILGKTENIIYIYMYVCICIVYVYV